MTKPVSLAVAIVGAGIAGLTCARHLVAAGHAVAVFEKSASPGGRAATRRTEIGGFDHGSQYFTVQAEAFAEEVASWQAAGVAAHWHGTVVSLNHGGSTPLATATPRFVGVPGMNAIGAYLARGLDARMEQRVIGLERVGEGPGARWALRCVSDADRPDGVVVTEGLYDAVVVAVPADQAVDLLAPLPALAARAAQTHLQPCWTLMLGFADALGLPYDAAFVDGTRLNWLARESSKPGRRAGERWVGQAGPAWSLEHLEDDPEDVKVKMLKAFNEATGNAMQPIHATVHRWRYSLAPDAAGEPCLWDSGARLGACGDWCGGPRIEGAWLSGRALARRIAGV